MHEVGRGWSWSLVMSGLRLVTHSDNDSTSLDSAQGRFLTYDNNVLEYVEGLNRNAFGGRMVNLHKHMFAVAYQLALLRDMWAVAR